MVLETPRRPKVRELQRKLWAAAKRSPNRRFHALYDRIFRGDVHPDKTKVVDLREGREGLDFLAWRLKRLPIKRQGRNLRAGQAARWTEQWLGEMGLYQLMGTIRYPGVA